MARLLVTGATGLLGSYLARRCEKLFEVVGTSRRMPSVPTSWSHRCLDLTDRPQVLRYFNETRPKIIIHCAALTDVERCEAAPACARQINCEAAIRLARLSAENQAKFVLISTDAVFGRPGVYREEDQPCPVNEYAYTKLAAELGVAACCPAALTIRTNFFGCSGRTPLSLAEWMLAKLLTGERFGAFTDVRFSPLFADDAAQLILQLVQRNAKGIFHLAARDSCSKYQFAILLAEAFQVPTTRIEPIRVDRFAFKAQRPRNTSLANEKLTHYLGATMPNVKQGVEAMRNEILTGARLQFIVKSGECVAPSL